MTFRQAKNTPALWWIIANVWYVREIGKECSAIRPGSEGCLCCNDTQSVHCRWDGSCGEVACDCEGFVRVPERDGSGFEWDAIVYEAKLLAASLTRRNEQCEKT